MIASRVEYGIPERATSILELIPVAACVDEAQDVSEPHWHERQRGVERGAVGHLQFQQHESDDEVHPLLAIPLERRVTPSTLAMKRVA